MDTSPGGSTPDALTYSANRVKALNFLYEADGRDDPNHPYHALYTGLADQARHAMGSVALETLTRTWHERFDGVHSCIVYLEDDLGQDSE